MGSVGGDENGSAGLMRNERNESKESDGLGYHSIHRQQQLEMRRKSSRRFYVFACAVLASLNSVVVGYGVGVMSGAIIFIQEDLKITEVQAEVLVGCLNKVSLFGSLTSGRTSDTIGRKWTMAVGAIVTQAGTAAMTFAGSFLVLLLGRLLNGIGFGIAIMITSVYIAEISPSISRGSLTSFPEIFVNVGILLGYVSNYALSGLSVHINWRVMLGVGILPSVLIGFALFMIPESPRWLVMQNRVDKARSVLLKMNGDESEVEERLAEIQLTAGAGNNAEENGQKAVWRELLSPSPSLRRMLITGIGLQCFQQLTGTEAVVYYSPEIFKAAGINGKSKLLAATVAVGVTKTSFIIVASVLTDKLGRKPLLYISSIGMTVCLCGVGVSLSLLKEGIAGGAAPLAILSVCSTLVFFSVGISPICWVVNSEIFPLRYRAQAVALGAAANRVCSGLVSMSFLSISRSISVAGTFFGFAAMSALSVAFIYLVVPETKGRSLEQIESLFQGRSRH
ncbi:hypothetical protein BT93_K1800 [Corymbia citriodora subsp. variegata]|nr:hypothetical protein BT93_K1800 [Corymbia citriodora subsp. variegata]